MNIAQLAGRRVNESDPTATSMFNEQTLVEPSLSSLLSTAQMLQVPRSASFATSSRAGSSSQQSASASSYTKEATVHFLKGSCKLRIPQALEVVNRVLAVTGGRVEDARYIYRDQDNLLWPGGMLWTCSNASETFFRALEDANFSFLWTPRDAVVHIRREGTITYGLRILSSNHVYDPKVQTTMGYSVVAELNRAYLQEKSTSTVGQYPSVTKNLGRGLYLFSGPEAKDLEDIVAAGRTTVTFYMPLFSTGDRTLNVVVEPFRLCDLP